MEFKQIMTDAELQKRALDIANNYNTCYLYGGTGQLVTNPVITQKAKQLPKWYTVLRILRLQNLVGKKYYGFDCVNLIKAILWGWSKGKQGAYKSNGVPDTNANGFINLCHDISTDMSNIQPMEAIWFDGHVGLYLGDGKCIECCPSLNKVGITDITYQKKVPWCRHGKLPWIEYAKPQAKRILKLTNPYMRGEDVERFQALIGVEQDGVYGTDTEKRVREILSYIR